jgi:hypothetical protein
LRGELLFFRDFNKIERKLLLSLDFLVLLHQGKRTLFASGFTATLNCQSAAKRLCIAAA